MFDWLDRELAEIRTRRFHVVDGPASPEFRAAVTGSALAAPPSYVDFVLRFGNASLYRMTGLDCYWLRVFAAPREVVSHSGRPLLYVADTGDTCAYFREETFAPGVEAPVYVSTDRGIRKAADSFGLWVARRAAWTRRRYTRREWAEVLRGPPPFTDAESDVVRARRLFTWRQVGVTPAGELLYEVSNGSDRRLPFLSVGVRARTGTLAGGVWLPVGHIGPGETAVVAKNTYRDLIDPADVEAYPLPDPEPEERARYWEFKPG